MKVWPWYVLDAQRDGGYVNNTDTEILVVFPPTQDGER